MPIKSNLSNKLFARGPRDLVVLIACLLIALVGLTKLTDYSRTISTIYYSQFLKLIEEKKIKTVHIDGNNVYGTTIDNNSFETVIQQDPRNIELLRKHDVDFSISSPTQQLTIWHLILMALLCAGVFGVWYFLRPSKNSSNGGSIFSFGKSKAKLFEPSHVNISFEDVAGAIEAKEELKDIVDYLKNPEKYKKNGAKIARGVLLVGEPGNGKTLLAKAVAGEAQCPFYSITGSDFIEVFVGIGASRVRDMFNQARQNAPSIIFIDEIELIGRQRGSGYPGGGHEEREQTLNQLLTEMDGFNTDSSSVIIIGATNMPDTLDKALLRPGRFDRKIEVPYPDLIARKEILTIHARSLLLDTTIDLQKIAQETAGFSGADLAQLLNKAALYASKKESGIITVNDLERAQQSMLSHEGSKIGMTNSVGKSHHITVYMPNQIKCNFSMVAGMPEVKQEVQDVIGFLKDPVKFGRLGAKISKGVLLTGKPGTGKTLLARAIAGEAHCPFFSVSGSEFIEVYVGTGAARVRELFVQARKYSPCIVFIDEIDSIGAKRQADASSGDGERYQTLNQLLVEMDGFQTNKSPIVVIAATNRPDVLDSALKRPGRFDRQIAIPLPFLVDREEILKTHAQRIVLADDVDLYKIARATPQWSGAELDQLINEAALIATKHDKQENVQLKDFEEARDRLIMGHGLSSLRSTPEQKYSTALHEAGHTLVAMLVPHTLPLHKVTITPRGQALGATFYIPENDSLSRSKDQLLGDIMVAMGGRIGEALVAHGVNSGVHNDFEQATELAHQMVRHYGMSEKLGHVSYPAHNKNQYSEATAALIDQEVRDIVGECYSKVKNLLTEHKDKLLKLAKTLVQRETMSAQEVYELLEMQPRDVFKFS